MLTKLLFNNASNLNSTKAHFGLLLLRLFAGLSMAFAHGTGKIPPNEQFVGFLEMLGLPMAIMFAWMAGLAEFVGGILIALGLLTRPAALSLIITMAVAAFLAHATDPFQKKEMSLLYFFIYLAILLMGPGKYSVDSKIIVK